MVFVILGIVIVVWDSFGSGNWFGDALALFSVFNLALIFTLLGKYPDINRFASVGLGGFLLDFVMFFFAEPSNFTINT